MNLLEDPSKYLHDFDSDFGTLLIIQIAWLRKIAFQNYHSQNIINDSNLVRLQLGHGELKNNITII